MVIGKVASKIRTATFGGFHSVWFMLHIQCEPWANNSFQPILHSLRSRPSAEAGR
jgi:hypothetical protein